MKTHCVSRKCTVIFAALQKYFFIYVYPSGVFPVDVSVMEGDSVTLIPLTVIPEDDTARWYFGDKIIAKINKADGLFSTSEGVDGRFKWRLNLDKQTGSLTIRNITPDNAGLYKLQIMSTTETFEIFSVTVTGEYSSLTI